MNKASEGQKLLKAVRESFPFLKSIPDDIYFQLGTKELQLPPKEILHLASELSEKLGHHVMTYNANIFDTSIHPKQHLCAILQGATLSKKQRALLVSYEKRTKEQGVTLVVYQKPVMLANIKETALYQYYLKNNLI